MEIGYLALGIGLIYLAHLLTTACRYLEITTDIERRVSKMNDAWERLTLEQKVRKRKIIIEKLWAYKNRLPAYENCRTWDQVCCHYFIDDMRERFRGDLFIPYEENIEHIFEDVLHCINQYYPPYIALQSNSYKRFALEKKKKKVQPNIDHNTTSPL